MADTRGPPHEPGLEARIARLESDVAHIQSDLGEVKSTLNRLAPIIDEMRGFLSAKLPELATKAEFADLRSETRRSLPTYGAKWPSCGLTSCRGRLGAKPCSTFSRS
jgi:hypothetical protein